MDEDLHERVNELTTRVDKLEEIHQDVKQILKIFNSSKGFFTITGFIGKFIIFGGMVMSAIWLILHGGHK